MAVERVGVTRVEIEDRPGALQEVLAGAAGAGVNVLHLAAFSVGGGKGVAYLVPDKPEVLKSFAESRGFSLSEHVGFLLSGRDRIGLGSEVTRPLADVGVNIVFSTATVSEGTYYLLIVVNRGDEEAAARALGG